MKSKLFKINITTSKESKIHDISQLSLVFIFVQNEYL